MNISDGYTFVVLAYNHSDYILEHLESVKYLVENYGDGLAIDLIIADDSSRDNTVALARLWLEKNSNLFRRASVLSDDVNRGTCKNLTRALSHVATKYCKITAGDDVYSCENLFVEIEKIDSNHILSGLPLNLIDGKLGHSRFDLFNIFATNEIYAKHQYMTRLKRINFFNSPSVVYATPALLNSVVKDFIERFSVTEDYPLQIKMAEIYRPLKFHQVEKIFVYYRRTVNSTYIVKSAQFNRDKVNIFNYLIESERNVLSRFLLRNRLFCYGLGNGYLKRILNLNLYLYGFCVFLNLNSILKKFKKFDAQLKKHQNHYDLVALRAKSFLNEF